jgi:hypothetical protein
MITKAKVLNPYGISLVLGIAAVMGVFTNAIGIQYNAGSNFLH